MTLTDARALRDTIRLADLHSVTPLGFGPDRYFARIWTAGGAKDFHSPEGWAEYDRQRQDRVRRSEHAARVLERPRSPIEIMIDRACGLE